MVTVDIWQLFIVLLATTMLQEFFIKPAVYFLKRYYHKGKSHIEKLVTSNGNH